MEGNKDDRIAMDSLKLGNWLTCTILDRQHRFLATVYPKSVYLPACYFTRLYDMPKQTYTLHPVLHKVYGSDLLTHINIVILVARPGHRASIWVDTEKRTIKYLDS